MGFTSDEKKLFGFGVGWFVFAVVANLLFLAAAVWVALMVGKAVLG